MEELKICLAGSMAGLCADLFVHPLDTLRARLQLQSHQTSQRATTLFTQMIRKEGFISLYKGFGAVFIGTVPGHALYFSSYEYFRKLFNQNQWNPHVNHLVSGFIADAFGSLAWTPMDVIKQKTQTFTSLNPGKQMSSLEVALNVYKQNGIFGFYRGFGVALMTYGPFVSIYFTLYEYYKTKANASTSLSHLSGAFGASAISAFLTCPLDVMKTRVQIGKHQYRNGLDAFLRILREEGIQTFFMGWKPRVLWMSLGTAFTMMFYEEFKKYLK